MTSERKIAKEIYSRRTQSDNILRYLQAFPPVRFLLNYISPYGQHLVAPGKVSVARWLDDISLLVVFVGIKCNATKLKKISQPLHVNKHAFIV